MGVWKPRWVSGNPWKPGTPELDGCLETSECQATVKLTPFGPVLIPTPIMLSCYRFLPPFSDLFSVVTSGSLVVFSGSTPVNLDRINPLLRFSRRR
jgi:hypothetical protein